MRLLAMSLLACSPGADPVSGSSSATGTPPSSGSTVGTTGPTGTSTASTTGPTTAVGSTGTTPPEWTGPPLVVDGPPPTNILVISADTLRVDHLGAYGGGTDTPFLDGLLADAAVLSGNRACASFTQASFTCLLLSTLALDFGYEPMSQDPEVLTTPGYLVTALAGLRDAGFLLGLATGNDIIRDGFPLSQDFDIALDEPWGTADRVNEMALSILDTFLQDGRPWYLHVHYMDVHTPYFAALEDPLEGLDDLSVDYDLASFEGVTALRMDYPTLSPDEQADALELLEIYYRAALRYMDDQVRLLWDELEARGALDDTLVVLWSDHGEQFWDRGSYGHDLTMHYEETASLLAFRGPGVLPHTDPRPVSTMDIVPTLLDLHGLPIPPQSRGISLLEDLPADRIFTGFRYFYGLPPRQYGIQGTYMVQYTWDGARSAYRLDVDPTEQVDVYDPADPRLKAIWAVMADDAAKADAFIPSWSPLAPGP